MCRDIIATITSTDDFNQSAFVDFAFFRGTL
jgi:hypothetical protein